MQARGTAALEDLQLLAGSSAALTPARLDSALLVAGATMKVRTANRLRLAKSTGVPVLAIGWIRHVQVTDPALAGTEGLARLGGDDRGGMIPSAGRRRHNVTVATMVPVQQAKAPAVPVFEKENGSQVPTNGVSTGEPKSILPRPHVMRPNH